jgi:hypothetical protein
MPMMKLEEQYQAEKLILSISLNLADEPLSLYQSTVNK